MHCVRAQVAFVPEPATPKPTARLDIAATATARSAARSVGFVADGLLSACECRQLIDTGTPPHTHTHAYTPARIPPRRLCRRTRLRPMRDVVAAKPSQAAVGRRHAREGATAAKGAAVVAHRCNAAWHIGRQSALLRATWRPVRNMLCACAVPMFSSVKSGFWGGLCVGWGMFGRGACVRAWVGGGGGRGGFANGCMLHVGCCMPHGLCARLRFLCS